MVWITADQSQINQGLSWAACLGRTGPGRSENFDGPVRAETFKNVMGRAGPSQAETF